MRTLIAAICLFGIATPALATEYSMSVVATGVRDYYCTFTARLENASQQSLDDLNGYFVLFADDEQVGESRSSSFVNTPSGGATETLFEAPNAPCDSITSLRFVVSACRIGPSFLDQAACAANLETTSPIREAVAR